MFLGLNLMQFLTRKFRFMFLTAKKVGVLFLVFLLGYFAIWLFQEDREIQFSFLETEKCPACYGESACGMLLNKELEFSGSSKFRNIPLLHWRNVHYAVKLPEGTDVVLKKLAENHELLSVDITLCGESILRGEKCNYRRGLLRSIQNDRLFNKSLEKKIIMGTRGYLFRCLSYNVLLRVAKYFKEYKKKDKILLSDKLSVLYSSMINSGALILQAFPKSEGWPFPEYIGACGRVVVEEYVGQELSSYIDAPFEIRADMAYQLLKIADLLTTKSDKFSLYLVDVRDQNFAVDKHGKVTIIDTEHIIVADKQFIQLNQPPGWNETHVSFPYTCYGYPCAQTDDDKVCSQLKSDHNYHLICRELFSKHTRSYLMPIGLLHDIPSEIEKRWNLGKILQECVHPTEKGGRWKAKDKLLVALKAVKDGQKYAEI